LLGTLHSDFDDSCQYLTGLQAVAGVEGGSPQRLAASFNQSLKYFGSIPLVF